MNHSPAPWIHSGKSIKAIDHGKWYSIAKIDSSKLSDEGNALNARLIAAAPDLLKALIECADYLSQHLDQGRQHKVIKAADEAISKATI